MTSSDDRMVLDRDLLAMIDGYTQRLVDADAPRSADLDAVEQIIAADPPPAPPANPKSIEVSVSNTPSGPAPALDTLVESWGMIWEDAKLVLSDALEETPAIGYAREFLAEAARGQVKILVLSGTKGVGKTVAACWVMRVARPELAGRSWPADRHPRIMTAAKIARWGAFGHDDERAALCRAKVTVIDDLGMEDPRAKGFVAYLGELVNERAGAPGYTVITTNLSSDELGRRYARSAEDIEIWDRIWDRFRQRAAWFDVAHASLRTR